MIFRFADCTLNIEKFEMRRDNEVQNLEPRVFELLCFLLENRDRMVSKDEIFTHVWNGRIVSESALSSQIKAVRKVIGDDGKAQALVRTVHGKGFRFVGDVEIADEAPARPLITPGIDPLEPITPDKPSIAVMPFDNLSGDPDQIFFSDGIAEDIIAALSKFRGFFVTARNSTFSYKGKHPTARQVADELGIQYVIDGSMRTSGDRLRISCHLVDAHTGRELWAERYDGKLTDIFSVQDDITSAIVGAVEPEIETAEVDRAMHAPTENLAAWENYQRGMGHLWQNTPDDATKARQYFERAISLDPELSIASAGISIILSNAVLIGWTDRHEKTLIEAMSFADDALKGDRRDAYAHYAKSRALTLHGDHNDALVELSIARDLNPNFALTHYGLGFTLAMLGRAEESIPHLERAIRQSPNDPMKWTFEVMLGTSLWHLQRHEEAKVVLEQARQHPNASFWPAAWSAINFISLGDIGSARHAVGDLKRNRSDIDLETVSNLLDVSASSSIKKALSNLRKAGLD
jgi:TolB-like protein